MCKSETKEEDIVGRIPVLDPRRWAVLFLLFGIALSIFFAVAMPSFLENAYR